MNIQKFYQFKAMESLNASLVALIPAFTLVILIPLFIQTNRLWIFALPFIFYSFVNYQVYLVNKDRIPDVFTQTALRENSHFKQVDAFAINFLPSASLRLLFFSKEGSLIGELIDINNHKFRWFLPYSLDSFLANKYKLLDSNHQLLASYQQLNRKQWQVLDGGGKQIGKVFQPERNLFVVETMSIKKITMLSSRAFLDIKYFDEEGTEILRVRRGWLPLKWGKSFKDPNTPILTFAPKLSIEDRTILLVMVIQALRYRDH